MTFNICTIRERVSVPVIGAVTKPAARCFSSILNYTDLTRTASSGVQKAPVIRSTSLSGVTQEFVKLRNDPISPDQRIRSGYGDFIVFDKYNAPLSPDVFHKVHPILTNHIPQVGQRYEEDRLGKVRELVQKIDKNLDSAFVPRTLYALFPMEHELDEMCPHSNFPMPSNSKFPPKLFVKEWKEEENEKPAAIRTAMSINNKIIKALKPDQYVEEGAFQYSRLQKEAQRIIGRFAKLRDLYEEKKFFPITEFERRSVGESGIISSGYRYPVFLHKWGNREVLMQSFNMDCQNDNCIIVSRTSNLKDDDTIYRGQNPKSLSYNQTLLEGMILDAGACCLAKRSEYDNILKCYIQRINASTHNVGIPLGDEEVQKYHQGFWFLPRNATWVGVYGYGEYFHARTRVPSFFKGKRVTWGEGIFDIDVLRQAILSPHTSEEIQAWHQRMKNHVTILDTSPEKLPDL